MTAPKLVLAGLAAVAIGVALLVMGSPGLGTEMNILPLSLTNEVAPFDAAELRPSINVTETVTGSLQVATAISKHFSVTVDSVVAMHNAGHGYGEIVKALSLAQMLGNKTAAADIFKLRAENQGWGKILKSLAVSKWDTSLGKLMHKSKQDSVDGFAPGNSGAHRQDLKNKDKESGGKDDDDEKNNGKGDDDEGDDKGNNGKGNVKGHNGKGKGQK